MNENPFASPEVPNASRAPGMGLGTKVVAMFLITAILGILVVFFLPLTRRGGASPQRVQCWHNLKQIGVALHNYHDKYGSFPPAFTVDSKGRPLHSWRTLLLPFLDQQNLYQQIDFSKPWNDPANDEAFQTKLGIFHCPSARSPDNHTSYLGVSGAGACFQAEATVAISDIKDGTSNTLIVVEVPSGKSVPWMSPDDASEAMILGIGNGSESPHTGGFQSLSVDGSVRFISVSMDQSTLRSILTISGNDVVGEF